MLIKMKPIFEIFTLGIFGIHLIYYYNKYNWYNRLHLPISSNIIRVQTLVT